MMRIVMRTVIFAAALSLATPAFAQHTYADGDKLYATDANGFLQKVGGTMTGPLVLSANPTSALQAAPKQYVDSAITALGSAAKVNTTLNLSVAATDASGNIVAASLPGYATAGIIANDATGIPGPVTGTGFTFTPNGSGGGGVLTVSGGSGGSGATATGYVSVAGSSGTGTYSYDRGSAMTQYSVGAVHQAFMTIRDPVNGNHYSAVCYVNVYNEGTAGVTISVTNFTGTIAGVGVNTLRVAPSVTTDGRTFTLTFTNTGTDTLQVGIGQFTVIGG